MADAISEEEKDESGKSPQGREMDVVWQAHQVLGNCEGARGECGTQQHKDSPALPPRSPPVSQLSPSGPRKGVVHPPALSADQSVRLPNQPRSQSVLERGASKVQKIAVSVRRRSPRAKDAEEDEAMAMSLERLSESNHLLDVNDTPYRSNAKADAILGRSTNSVIEGQASGARTPTRSPTMSPTMSPTRSPRLCEVDDVGQEKGGNAQDHTKFLAEQSSHPLFPAQYFPAKTVAVKDLNWTKRLSATAC